MPLSLIKKARWVSFALFVLYVLRFTPSPAACTLFFSLLLLPRSNYSPCKSSNEHVKASNLELWTACLLKSKRPLHGCTSGVLKSKRPLYGCTSGVLKSKQPLHGCTSGVLKSKRPLHGCTSGVLKSKRPLYGFTSGVLKSKRPLYGFTSGVLKSKRLCTDLHQAF